MACPTTFVALAEYTQHFVEELRYLPSPMTVLTEMIQRGTYPEGFGKVMTTFQIGRSLPVTDNPEFVPITTSTTDTCSVTYNDVPVGYKALNFRPEVFGWQGPTICADNLYYEFERVAFLNSYMRAMKKNVDWTIEHRYESIYDYYVPKAAASETLVFTDPATGYPTQTPDLSTLARTSCQLSQQMLDQAAAKLIEEGAMEGAFSDDWVRWGPNGPEFTLQIGVETSANLLKQASELRTDYRYAEMGLGAQGSSIIKRLGTSKVIGNFRHLVVQLPPRYNWVPGTGYVRVPTWVADPSATEGTVTMLNPEWRSADFEAVRVLHPEVFRDLIIPPVLSSGGMTTWEPRNYLGQWQFVSGAFKFNTDCPDPLEKYGRHFAEFHHAPEPLRQEVGLLIIFRRCTNTSPCIQCTTGAT